jgi:glutamate dehydrogenase (NAD(P)+)
VQCRRRHGIVIELVQDLYGFWTENEVNQYLERTMNAAFKEVYGTAESYRVDMRTGAYILAVSRVAEATRVRGIFP